MSNVQKTDASKSICVEGMIGESYFQFMYQRKKIENAM